MSNTPIDGNYIKAEGKAGRMGARLMAIVAEGKRGRIYLSPTLEMETVAFSAKPNDVPDTNLPVKALGFNIQIYGMTKWRDLFTPRQLVALTTFSDLIPEAIAKVKNDFLEARAACPKEFKRIIRDAMPVLPDDDLPLAAGGVGAAAYAEAVGVYLSFGISRAADAWSSVVTWRNQVEASRNTFARQAVPITWDFTEINPFSTSCGHWLGNSIEWVEQSLLNLPLDSISGKSIQEDARIQNITFNKVVSIDPPYYDNIGYADLSDFFYIWLRRSVKPIFPDLFATLVVPKAAELIAATYRHTTKKQAESFFLDGMTEAMHRLAEQAHPAYPVTIYYAFKQSDTTEETDTNENGTSNTGWETFLAAVINAGFAITGTWPMRTERHGRVRSNDANALASSVILVCRQRDPDAPIISRREFVRELKTSLDEAVNDMINGAENESPIAPVDLAQAVIGPGMAIYTKYAAVLEANGDPVSLHTALILINRVLTEDTDNFDSVTQFCLSWCAEYGWNTGEFGQADVLARARGSSVDRAKTSGVIEASGGHVRLLPYTEYPKNWSPDKTPNVPIWAALNHLNLLLQDTSSSAAGRLLAKMRDKSPGIRNLAYRLHTLCNQKRWTEEARIYNDFITSWDRIHDASYEV